MSEAINYEVIKKSLSGIEEEYTRFQKEHFGNWEIWADASEKVYNREPVDESKIPKAFHNELRAMKILLEMEDLGEFDWNSPKLREAFAAISGGVFHQFFGKTIAEIAITLAELIKPETLLEIGAGNGKLTRLTCETMRKKKINLPMVITDSKPVFNEVIGKIKEDFPEAKINPFLWNKKEEPKDELKAAIKRPSLLYERYTITYTSVSAIANIAKVADFIVLGDWLSITGKTYGYDKAFAKIGAKTLLYDDVKAELNKYYNQFYFFDKKAQEAINSPYVSILVAWRRN